MRVVVDAEVSKKDVLGALLYKLYREVARVGVAQVSVSAGDTRLERIRIRPLPEHVFVVI